MGDFKEVTVTFILTLNVSTFRFPVVYSVRRLERSELGAQGAFGTDFYDRSTRTIVGPMLWTEYRLVIKIGPKGALGSHKIRPIHSAPSLGQSIEHYRKNSKISTPGMKLT